MSVEDSFKINLNQNLWGLIVSYAALGASEYFKLGVLFWFSVVVAGGLSLSVLITFGFYTYNYCKHKST
jgi:hypothetical protein